MMQCMCSPNATSPSGGFFSSNFCRASSCVTLSLLWETLVISHLECFPLCFAYSCEITGRLNYKLISKGKTYLSITSSVITRESISLVVSLGSVEEEKLPTVLYMQKLTNMTTVYYGWARNLCIYMCVYIYVCVCIDLTSCVSRSLKQISLARTESRRKLKGVQDLLT